MGDAGGVGAAEGGNGMSAGSEETGALRVVGTGSRSRRA